MDQKKTGRFIAEMRKKNDLTQREFADILGISDKTVSKWETGNGWPDVSLMQPVCEALGINLNELFSGERIDKEKYELKAEENLFELLRERETYKRNIVGGEVMGEAANVDFDACRTHEMNAIFWDTIGSETLGITALPSYGGFVTEDSLGLLGDLSGKKVLEIGCGNGRSLEYVHLKGASALWGLDISQKQILRTRKHLKSKGIDAHLICAPMEDAQEVPKDYFDVVFSVFGVGWSTDLSKTFANIHASLKHGGSFVFNWSHPIHKCVSEEKGELVFSNSYFDESWYVANIGKGEVMLSNRKLSTYINELVKAGFVIEKLVEENEDALLEQRDDPFSRKARMLPMVFVIKARKI